MRLYWEVARRGFRRYSTYRGATLAGVVTNTVFGFIQAYVMLAIFRQRSDVGGFDLTDALTYVFVTQGLLMVVGVMGGQGEIGQRIRSGDIVSDLYRPVDFQGYWLALDLGRALFHMIFRGVPPFLVGAVVFDLRLPSDPVIVGALLVSLVLATVIAFAVRFLMSMAAFWVLDDRGPVQVITVVWMFFSGFILPINFFPGWLEAVARVLPFATMVQAPVEVFLGKHAGVELLAVLAVQVAWLLALFALSRLVLARATRRVVVQGG